MGEVIVVAKQFRFDNELSESFTLKNQFFCQHEISGGQWLWSLTKLSNIITRDLLQFKVFIEFETQLPFDLFTNFLFLRAKDDFCQLGTILTIKPKHIQFAESQSAPANLLRIIKKIWFKWSWLVDLIHPPDLFYIQRVDTSNFLRIESESGNLVSSRCAIASRGIVKKKWQSWGGISGWARENVLLGTTSHWSICRPCHKLASQMNYFPKHPDGGGKQLLEAMQCNVNMHCS